MTEEFTTDPGPDRGPLVVLVVVLALLAGVLAVALWPVDPSAPPAVPSARTRASAQPSRLPAPLKQETLAILHTWDSRRAAAWASGDVLGLRRLYAPGSRAGRADVAMLRTWLRRGYRVEGMGMQVLRVEAGESTPGRREIKVTDRLVDAVAVRGRQRLRLPRDRATTRRIVLVRIGDDWRVARVAAG